MSEIPNEVKIIHVHKAIDNHEHFIEFLSIKNGKSHILRENSFIKRYGSEIIEEYLK